METWKITPGAANLVGRLIVSCHELNLDEKSKAIACKAMGNESVCEIDFLQADKMGLYDNLLATAKDLSKSTIDREVVIKCFGSRRHEQSALNEVVEVGQKLPVQLHIFLLVHLLIPLKIIGQTEDGLIGEYCNDGKSVKIENILLFKDDLGKDLTGKTVLFHYAPVIQAETDPEIIAYLLEEQKKCAHFMEALEDYNGKTIKIGEFSKAIKRTIKNMEL